MADDLVNRLREVAAATGPNDAAAIVWDAAARIEALTEAFTDLQRGQTYRYIGRDGKTVLACDLEDRIEALTADLAAAKARAAPLFADDADRIEALTADLAAAITRAEAAEAAMKDLASRAHAHIAKHGEQP
jgi:hypothetical protein